MNVGQLVDFLWAQLHLALRATGRNQNKLFRQLYKEICILLSPNILLEVGACEAAFSIELSKELPSTKFVALEANPFVYNRYRGSMPESVKYINLAAGTDCRPKQFFIPRTIPGREGLVKIARTNTTSSLRPRIDPNVVNEKVEVECETLDSIISKLVENLAKARVACWIDVEGAVGDVLFGAHQALKASIDSLFVEVESRPAWSGQWTVEDVRSYLVSCGFISIARDCETEWQYNEIYIRRDLLTTPMLALIKNYVGSLVAHAR